MKNIKIKIIKILFTLTLTVIFILPAYAKGTVTVKSYSTEQIKEMTLKELKDEVRMLNYSKLGNQNDIKAMAKDVYTEEIVSYTSKGVELVDDCFEVGRYSFDTEGSPVTEPLSVTFTQMDSIAWTYTGTISGSTEATIFGLIEAKISTSHSIARESSSTSSLTVTVGPINVAPDSYGVGYFYANGYKATGEMKFKYQWNLEYNQTTGYRIEKVVSKIPYAKYNTQSIHKGPIDWKKWNGKDM